MEATTNREHRFDPPHAKVPGMGVGTAVAEPGVDLPVYLQRIRLQTQQIADLFKERQAELDRRESQLQTQNALLEKKLRSLRLAANERRAEFEEHSHVLANQDSSLAEQLAANQAALNSTEAEYQRINGLRENLILREEAMEKRDQAIIAREQELAVLEANLHRQSLELQQQKQYLAAQAVIIEDQETRVAGDGNRLRRAHELSATQARRMRELADHEADMERREDKLQEQETLLQKRLAAADERLHYLDHRHNELEARFREEKRLISETRRQAELQISRAKQDLARRGEELSVRTTALEQTRNDLAAMHRETLELRLCTEEVWTQLQGAVAPLVVNESLARSRRRLDDHYRLQKEDLVKERQELMALAERLGRQHSELKHTKDDFQKWMEGRQAEFEAETQRLADHARQLQLQKDAIEEERIRWQNERERLQQQVRNAL